MESQEPEDKPKRGRPGALTPELRAAFIQHVELGLTYSDAAALCGLSENILNTWRRRAREGREPYASFIRDVEAAKLTLKRRALTVIALAAQKKDWKAGSWLLERKFPKEYAPRIRVYVQEELADALGRLTEAFGALSESTSLTPGQALELALAALAGEGAAPTEAAGAGGPDVGPGEELDPSSAEPDPA